MMVNNLLLSNQRGRLARSAARLCCTCCLLLLSCLALFPTVANGQTRPRLQRTQELVAEGQDLLNKNNYEAALTRFNSAIRVEPSYGYAYMAKGWALVMLNRPDEALAAYNEALTRTAEPSQVYWSICATHLARGRYREAATACEAATRRDNSSAVAYDSLASAYFGLGEYNSAVQASNRATTLAPDKAEYWATLGDAYSRLSQWQDTVQAYQRVVQLKPDWAIVHFLIGQAYSRLNQPRDAIRAYDQAIEHNIESLASTLYYKGLSHTKLEQYTEANAAFQQALQATPHDKGDYRAISFIYSSRGLLPDAIRVIRQAIELRADDDDSGEYIGLSWYYSFMEQHEAAMAAATRAIALDPKEYMGYTNRCRAYNDLGTYDKALADCQQALRLKPDDGETLYYMGRAYRLQGDPQRATDFNKRAIPQLAVAAKKNFDESQIGNTHDSIYLLGNALFEDGRFADAIEGYKLVVKLRPNFALSRFNLGVAYLHVGNRPGALEQYRALQSIDPRRAGLLKSRIDSSTARNSRRH